MGKYFVEVDLVLDTGNDLDGIARISAGFPNQCEINLL